MLVLDANIRAVLGARVLVVLGRYVDQAKFFAPDRAFQEAREHISAILNRRGMPVARGMAILDALTKVVQTVELETYSPFESLRVSTSLAEMKTTGRYWRPLLR